MINKRLLIKNLIIHSGEINFYDKKLLDDICLRVEKAKFLKHVCCLSNTNLNKNSYIVIGVEDENNLIVGVDFFDGIKIQNLINTFLEHTLIAS